MVCNQYNNLYNNYKKIFFYSEIKKFFFHTDLVLNLLSASDENVKMEVSRALEEGLMDIKNIANNFKQHVKTDKS